MDSGLARSARPGMTACVLSGRSHITSPSRGANRVRGFRFEIALGIEGAGKAGYRLIPAVRVQQKSTRQNHRSAEYPAFPARWFDGLYVLSSGTGSLAPVTRTASTGIPNLAPAPGRQDHTISPTHRCCSSA